MPPSLRRHWFLLALTALIGGGLAIGAGAPPEAVQAFDAVFSSRVKSLIVAGVLFCMSVTLDGRRFGGALASPGPVLVGLLFSAVLMPLAAPLLMPLQLSEDFAVGLMIAASVPCTLAAASVWTRRAGGNDAIALLVTMITNGLCFLITPFWLGLFASRRIELDEGAMVTQLALTALLPIVAGQAVRRVAGLAAAADRAKTVLGTAAQIGILSIVFVTALDGGERLSAQASASSEEAAPGVMAVLVVAVSCIALHCAGLWLALLAGKLLRFAPEDRIAVALAGSQKTLPIGVLIATHEQMYGADYPWAVFPMLMFHASQLFIDTAIADRHRSRVERDRTGSADASDAAGGLDPGSLPQ